MLSFTLQFISSKEKPCILLGNFNIDMLKSESDLSAEFLNILYISYLYPLTYKPTRITCSSATLIDNIVTNYFESAINSGLLLNDIKYMSYCPGSLQVYRNPQLLCVISHTSLLLTFIKSIWIVPQNYCNPQKTNTF